MTKKSPPSSSVRPDQVRQEVRHEKSKAYPTFQSKRQSITQGHKYVRWSYEIFDTMDAQKFILEVNCLMAQYATDDRADTERELGVTPSSCLEMLVVFWIFFSFNSMFGKCPHVLNFQQRPQSELWLYH
ncbi:hypothetical protein ILYODFUR_030813 [Ilyodon furcidens]|uniref:Uncharacterized protein n=1 Tax=Ilyodon furcidens TaxID=33524 RepID=A0ABV0U081_9TELE